LALNDPDPNSFFSFLDSVAGPVSADISTGTDTGATTGEEPDDFFTFLDSVAGVTTGSGEPIEPAPVEEPGVGGEFTGGVVRGAKSELGLFTAFGATLSQAFGFDETAADMFQRSKAIEDEANATDPKTVTTIEEAVESPGKFVLWAAATLGEQVPILASIVAGGGAGGILARLGAKGLAKGASKDALRKLTRRGATAGGFGVAAGIETGSTALEQIEGGVEPSPALSLAGGAAKGALEIITPFLIAQRFGAGVLGPALIGKLGDRLFGAFARRGLPTRIAVGAGGIALGEGATETAQEAIDLTIRSFVDENFDALGPDGRSRLLNSAAAGLLVGGGFGGITSALTTKRISRATAEDNGAPTDAEIADAAEAPPRRLQMPQKLLRLSWTWMKRLKQYLSAKKKQKHLSMKKQSLHPPSHLKTEDLPFPSMLSQSRRRQLSHRLMIRRMIQRRRKEDMSE